MNDVLTEMKLATANPTDNPELYATPTEVRIVQQAGDYADHDPEEMAEQAYSDPEALAEASEQMQAYQAEVRRKREAQAAEMALLRHLALEGELSLRRDQLQAEHQAVTQRLAQARQQRQGLVEAVQAAGGKLPSWEG